MAGELWIEGEDIRYFLTRLKKNTKEEEKVKLPDAKNFFFLIYIHVAMFYGFLIAHEKISFSVLMLKTLGITE